MNLVADLKQRKLVQWSVAYVATAFALIQGLDVVAHQFAWPDWSERVLIIACCVGFFITLLLAWYHGERGQQKVTSTELLLLAMLLGIGALLLWKFAPKVASAEAGAAQPAHPAPTAAADPINPRSIAVLPFADLSPGKDNAYLAEGIQDEILTRLSKIAELKVVSRTSTMRYASSPDNLREIARTLGVSSILEGSVEKVGNAVRINVQLIQADTDNHLWAEIYDRKLDDIFAVQSEVTTAIAKALRATLTASERQDVAAKPTSSTRAYEAYLRGIAAERISEYTRESNARARDAYQEAVQLDPNFAEAWSRLTNILSLRYANELRTPADLAAIKRAADATTRLRPGSVNAQLAQAYYQYRGLHDYPGALVAFSQVVGREPHNVEALAAMAYVERRLGDMDGALAQLTKAEALDPANPTLLTFRGEILSATRRYPEALAAFGKAQKLSPADTYVISEIADAYQAQGNLAAAEAVLEHSPRGDPAIQPMRFEQAWLSNQPDRFAEECRQNDAFLTAQRDPSGPSMKLYCQLRIAYLQHLQGKQADAVSSCRTVPKALAQPGAAISDFQALLARGMAHACLGDRSGVLSDFARLESLAHGDARAAPGVELELARAQMWLGDSDATLATLTHSLTVPYGTAVGFLRLDPYWQPLRDDPRFKALLAAEQR